MENVDYISRCNNYKMKQNIHITNICSKANRTLGFLRRNLFCPQDVKEAAYKGVVHSVLEYGSSIWDPHNKCLREELEKVQDRTVRFVTRNYTLKSFKNAKVVIQLYFHTSSSSIFMKFNTHKH